MATTVLLRNAPEHALGAFTLKPTSVTPGQSEGSVDLWTAPGATGGPVETGIWQAEPGTFTATRDGYHEICYLISGRVTLTEEGEEPLELEAGDLFVTPAGWRGTWQVHESLRKVFVIVPAPVAGA
ncbi:MAG: hypothetical protein RL499_1454 [Actinomycetota bacterium]|jgi:uncharacterized protein